jgi:regulatory protein YycI of two-component signal transduction system YycFG
MKSIFKFLLILSAIFLTTTLFAQLDNNNGSKEKGKIKAIVINNSKEVKIPKSLELEGTEGFKKAYDSEKEKLKKRQEEDNLKNKGILTQAKLMVNI